MGGVLLFRLVLWVRIPFVAVAESSREVPHAIVKCIKAEVLNLALNACLDDGTLVGAPGDLAAVLSVVKRVGPSVSLHLNRGKPVSFIPSKSEALQSPLPSGIPVTCQEFCLFDCLIGLPSFSEEVLWDRIAKVKISFGGSA